MKRNGKGMLTMALSLALSGAVISAESAAQPVIVPEESTFFATVFVEEASTYNAPSNGDLWPSA